MSKHTPGPYYYDPPPHGEWIYRIDSETGVTEGIAYDVCKYDGPLLAKAPDMYDLIMKLSRCVVYVEGGTIMVRDWQMLEEVLRAGYAIYQEVEGDA